MKKLSFAVEMVDEPDEAVYHGAFNDVFDDEVECFCGLSRVRCSGPVDEVERERLKDLVPVMYPQASRWGSLQERQFWDLLVFLFSEPLTSDVA